MSITEVVVGAAGLDSGEDVDEEEEVVGAVDEVDEVLEGGGEEEKCSVMRAGAVASSVRVTVMGIAGLWYFRRTR
jgi:hypothetical protein